MFIYEGWELYTDIYGNSDILKDKSTKNSMSRMHHYCLHDNENT